MNSDPTPPEANPAAALFTAALALPAAERLAYLDSACGQDTRLRERVIALLRAHDAPENFLRPVPGPQSPSPNAQATVTLAIEKPGDHIGFYKLLEKIGEGGWGVVYMAEQERPVRRRVALKILKPGMDSSSVMARFEAERQAVALMDHANIAKVFDAGATETGRPYFVMELVRGVRITDYCDQHNLSTRDRLLLFILVCQAIQHAHQKGIIHRDIKPSNVLVTVNDGVPVPKVIDFGIAKAIEQKLTDKTLFTQFAALLGTPAYMSPEQAEMTSLDIDTRSDLYSLGVLLYELLTGRTPFNAKGLMQAGFDEMRRTIRERDPARPSTCLRDLTAAEQTTTAQRRRTDAPKLIRLLHGDLDWIVMRTLEKDRQLRYPTANDLAADLRRHLNHEPVLARPPSRLYQIQKMVRRHRLAVTATAAILVILAAGSIISTWFFFRQMAARQISELRNAELASRSGRWPEALRHWDAAQRAGYNDLIDLGLKRAEAYIVLQNRPRARAEFEKLLRRSALGERTSSVFLRAGEFEMFERATFAQGVQRVRAASTNGLNAAERALAQGLLADSTPAALASFRRALEFDPFFPSAHRHSLGLEFVLGRHQELATHLKVLRALHPNEFSPGFIEAAELALHGRLADAQANLAALSNRISSETFNAQAAGLRLLARAADYFEAENYVTGTKSGLDKLQLITEASSFFKTNKTPRPAGEVGTGLPQLPCLEQGIEVGFSGVTALMLPLLGDQDTAIEKVRAGWRRHPEALFPVFAGMLLESRHPREGPRSPELLAIQSELYQMGVNSPSVIPNLARIARLQAADVQAELAVSTHTNAAWARAVCLTNLQGVLIGDMTSPSECRVYFSVARQLDRLDLARSFLTRWEQLRPGDSNAAGQRVRLEIASGAYGPALQLIDSLLGANPTNQWALTQRLRVLEKIDALAKTARPPAKNNP